jgi:hypothetical protein
VNLGDLQFRTQLYLRDPNGTFYSTKQLNYFINQARANVINDTLDTRAFATFNLVPAKELYTFQANILPAVMQAGYSAQQIVCINNLTFEWTTNLKIALDRLPWSKFNAIYRSFQIQIFPTIYSMFDYQSFYVAPIPSTVYVMEVDCVYLPVDLVNATDQEVISQAWAELIPINAAYLAKQYEQARAESVELFNLYTQELHKRFGVQPAFVTPSQYGNPIGD